MSFRKLEAVAHKWAISHLYGPMDLPNALEQQKDETPRVTRTKQQWYFDEIIEELGLV